MIRIDQAELETQQRFIDQVSQILNDNILETGSQKRYWLHTYGCQLNENDSEKIAGLLEEMGYRPTTAANKADLILLNTCSVRENATDRLFGNLGGLSHLRRANPELIVAICGCMTKQEENVDRIGRSFSFVDLVFGPQDIHRLPQLLYQRLVEGKKQYLVGQEDTIVEGLPVKRARRFRALCTIMYGCNNFCTYCIVPYTRGRERSRTPADVLGELEQLAADGYQEVMLLGQNVNSYGLDQMQEDAPLKDEFSQCGDFADLLAAVAKLGFYRIRFMTSHPKDISDKLLHVMAENPVIEPHLHLPVQSGSNRILRRMNRKYTREQYLTIVAKARSLMPDIAITTDIIVGFPGETEADFADTLDLMERVRFDSAFTFQYSKRSGTPAEKLAEQVEAPVMRERFDRLISLQYKHSLASNQKSLGQVVEVLVEGPSLKQKEIYSGRTGQSQLVNFAIPDPGLLPGHVLDKDGNINPAGLEGSIVKVLIKEAKTFSLNGIMEAWHEP